jgi:hypothetical protein
MNPPDAVRPASLDHAIASDLARFEKVDSVGREIFESAGRTYKRASR